jgi:hypothetical protein
VHGLRNALVAAVVLVGAEACGTGPNPNSSQSVPASASGIRSLFEAECLDWKSIEWAKRKYESERAACQGAITAASIADCRSNVTGVDWTISATDAALTFKLSYFFDEVEHPSKEQATCEIYVPKELGGAVQTAARDLASAHSLAGPFKSGKNGFSRPTLTQYWTDQQGRPRMGVFYYPADTRSTDPVEQEHTAYPWTLTQFPDGMLP